MFSFQHAGPVEWIVVGLGNPGPKYDWTRHNVGFLVVDELADRANIPVQRVKYKALTNTTKLGGKSVLLMKPVTYMNLSGEAVGQAARFYRSPRSGSWSSRTTSPCPRASSASAAAAPPGATTA